MEYKLKNDTKIILRDVLVSDAGAVLEYIHKVNVESKNLMREPAEFKMTLKEEEAFLKSAIESNDSCFLVAYHDDLLISTAGFKGSALKRVNHRVSFGISVLKEYQNLGVARIVMKDLIKKAREFKKTKMDLEVRVDNLGAIHLYETLGFIKEGIIKRGFCVDNKYVDLLIMGKLL